MFPFNSIFLCLIIAIHVNMTHRTKTSHTQQGKVPKLAIMLRYLSKCYYFLRKQRSIRKSRSSVSGLLLLAAYFTKMNALKGRLCVKSDKIYCCCTSMLVAVLISRLFFVFWIYIFVLLLSSSSSLFVIIPTPHWVYAWCCWIWREFVFALYIYIYINSTKSTSQFPG